jgi:hypothetical protein
VISSLSATGCNLDQNAFFWKPNNLRYLLVVKNFFLPDDDDDDDDDKANKLIIKEKINLLQKKKFKIQSDPFI